MKTGKILFALALLATAGSSWAGHVNVGVGVSVGVPAGYYYGPGYYYPPRYYYPRPYPYYYPPSVVVVPPAEPPVYIEQGQEGQEAQASQLAPGYWYYCANPAGYYPTVRECPNGWQQVAPTTH